MIYFFKTIGQPDYFVHYDDSSFRITIHPDHVSMSKITWEQCHDFKQFRYEQSENIMYEKCKYEPISEEEFDTVLTFSEPFIIETYKHIKSILSK